MSAFDGKWVASSITGGLAYLEAMGAPQEWKDKMVKLAEAVKSNPSVYVEEFHVSGNTFTRTVFINGEKRKDSGVIQFGTEVQGHVADGRDAKVKVEKASDTKLVRTECGAGFSTTTTFEVSGNTLTATGVAGGATCVTTFTKQ